MDKQRVNRITVSLIDDGDGAKMTLYRTNTKLGEICNGEINIPPFHVTKLPNKPTYMSYCKNVLIKLMNEGGLPEFYYDPEVHVRIDMPRKFDNSTFKEHARNMIYEILEPIQTSLTGVIKLFDVLNEDEAITPQVDRRYKDGNIEYGTIKFDVEFESEDGKSTCVVIPVHIKSGQLCKPKTFILDGTEKNITTNNIAALVDGKPIRTTSPKNDAKPADKPSTTVINTPGSSVMATSEDKPTPVVESPKVEIPVDDTPKPKINTQKVESAAVRDENINNLIDNMMNMFRKPADGDR